MKYVVLISLLLLLVGCDTQIGSHENDDERVFRLAEHYIPLGANVLEVIPTTNKTGAWQYVIFEFREECFMTYSGFTRNSLVNIKCPKDE